MGTQQFIKFLGPLVLFFGSVMVVHADLPHPLTVDFPAPLHFLTPGGEDVVLPAGMYQVEVAESWLKLIPDGQRRTEAMLVDAISGAHEETLTEVTVRLEGEPDNPDIFHLAMLQPDGSGLEAVGTTSGIRPRGWKSAFVGKFRKARTFTARPKVLHPGPVAQAQPAVPFKNVFKVP